MKNLITARKMTLKDSTKEHVEEKLNKLDKFFNDQADAHVTIFIEHDHVVVELTIHDHSTYYRAQKKDRDATVAFDMAVDSIIRKIRKNKTRLEKRVKNISFPEEYFPETVEEEFDFNVIKTKRFLVKPLDTEEAILQMNLIGHKFFVYRNVETNDINVVYKRKDGNYGVIEPE